MLSNPDSELLNLAELYIRNSQNQIAIDLLNNFLSTKPDDARANELISYAWDGVGKRDLALSHLAKACGSDSCSYQALYSFGSALLERQSYEEAIAYISAALNKNNFFEGLHNLGLAYIGLNKFNDAANCFRQALIFTPNSFEVLNNLGATLRNLGDFEGSLDYLKAAADIRPQDESVWLNMGVTFSSIGDFEKSLICYDKVLGLNPSNLQAICNKANSLYCLKNFDDANSLYIKALELKPNDVDTHYNQSLLLLLSGEFALGWEKYESRWHSVDAPDYLPGAIPPLNATQNLSNKRVLVWAEQGLGDTIQFCRYVALLSQQGAKVTLLVQPALAELLKNIDGVEKLEIHPPSNLANFDFQIPLLSLPYFFKTDLSNIPVNIPYIFPNSEKVACWKSQIATRDQLKVGIVWSGGLRKDSPSHWAVNHRRNIPFSEIAVLQDVEGVNFYSLQKGEPAESEFLKEGTKLWTKANLINVGPKLKDFSDTAALIENLDLVITVDTSTAHLAAAMGKPVWILNRFDACWRWLRDRSDSPWYPSVQLYRQVNSGDWSELMTRVATDLKELVTKTSITR